MLSYNEANFHFPPPALPGSGSGLHEAGKEYVLSLSIKPDTFLYPFKFNLTAPQIE